MDIHGLEVGAAKLFANLNAKNCREAARNLAGVVGLQVSGVVLDLFVEEYRRVAAEMTSATPPPAKPKETKDAVPPPKAKKKEKKSKKKKK